MFKKDKKQQIKYQDDYFFILGCWWIREQDNNFEFCRKISDEEVPEEIKLNW